MDVRDRLISGVILAILFVVSVKLNFFPSKGSVGRGLSAIFYVGSPLYPYGRVLFPVAFVALYLVRRNKKGELTVDQEIKLWHKRDE